MDSDGRSNGPTDVRPIPVPVQPSLRAPPGVGRGGAFPRTNGPPMATRIPPGLQAKMAAIASRSAQNMQKSADLDAATAALMRTGLSDSAAVPGSRAAPFVTPGAPMGARRKLPNLRLADIAGKDSPDLSAAGLGAGRPSLADPNPPRPAATGTPFANFSKIVDPSGRLHFGGKAILHSAGVDFTGGQSFAISMQDLKLEDELGRGNYGTVKRVLHVPTNVAMAMKEIRLELEDSKLNAIIMELDVLHRARAPEIIDFYGAFFIESCVYYCMEFMDAGSLDKLQAGGVPEDVVSRIAASMCRGLKFLKDDLQIIHRDVKPTNVLVNMGGFVKLCDFGVSGQLEKSLAKTNIGCQSYMAPERIKGESQNKLGTYTVQSDVWSFGLSLIEMAVGQYPYPPETYSNVFAQLTAIVHGDPPHLPMTFSEIAHSFIDNCLEKDPLNRPTYAELLEHPFLVNERTAEIDMKGWIAIALERCASGVGADKPQPPASLAGLGA